LVTQEEIERRSNFAKAELDRALREAQAAKADYERLTAQRTQLQSDERDHSRAAAQLDEERLERVTVLAEKHQRVADLQQALTGNPDDDPPLVGMSDQLAALPVPGYSREELQQHRVLSAGQVTLERQRQARENAFGDAVRVLEVAERMAKSLPVPLHSREELVKHQVLAGARTSLEAQAASRLAALEQARAALVDAQGRYAAVPVPTLSREELKQHQVLASARAVLETQAQNLSYSMNQARVVLEDAQKKYVYLPVPTMTREDAQAKLFRAAALNSSVEAAERAVNPFLDSVRVSQGRESSLSAEVTEVGGRLRKDRDLHPILDALVRAFDRDLPQTVLRQLLPRFNSYLQGYLDELLPACKLTFNEALQDNLVYEGQEVAARQLSTGQRARVNFAVCMATFSTMLWERGCITNVAFFDEVLDFGLDDAGQQEAFEQLKGMSMAVFIITHKATLNEEFDSQYVAQRVESGFTQLTKVA
jgi:hypothetical protein